MRLSLVRPTVSAMTLLASLGVARADASTPGPVSATLGADAAAVGVVEGSFAAFGAADLVRLRWDGRSETPLDRSIEEAEFEVASAGQAVRALEGAEAAVWARRGAGTTPPVPVRTSQVAGIARGVSGLERPIDVAAYRITLGDDADVDASLTLHDRLASLSSLDRIPDALAGYGKVEGVGFGEVKGYLPDDLAFEWRHRSYVKAVVRTKPGSKAGTMTVPGDVETGVRFHVAPVSGFADGFEFSATRTDLLSMDAVDGPAVDGRPVRIELPQTHTRTVGGVVTVAEGRPAIVVFADGRDPTHRTYDVYGMAKPDPTPLPR